MTQMYPGWHFCAMQRGKPVLRDGSMLEIGRTYEWTGHLEMCRSGYHDSIRVIDALRYAPGPYLCRVLSSADIVDGDKRCSRLRVAVAGIDATAILHRFSARIAFCALLAQREAGREPDPRSWEAVAVKMRWCDGDATDSELSAAESAAESAAWSAKSAARSAARSAASAAWSAESAARSAARSAASAAMSAESAAWSAAWSADSAAWSADSAARSAKSAADVLLTEMLPDSLVHVV